MHIFFVSMLHNDHAFHGFLDEELKLPKELNILVWLFVSPKQLTE